MTIPALLKHHGVDVPRYVTVDGQIVFDGVRTSVTGATHPVHALITAVAPHTFHGGVERLSVRQDSNWWDDKDALLIHKDAMAVAFPGFAYVRPTEDQAPAWFGTINTGRGSFKVGVFLRRDGGLPSIRVFGPRLGAYSSGRWTASPHLYLNGNLCVADQSDWDAQKHTAVTATAWAAHWLSAYTEWRMSRRWPVEGVRHVLAES
ncbi:hypothetical protein E8P82_14240 [Arthrobacter echini]|uniref:Type II CBASS E2 protein domain-containing protein n=1 Tax=Arthrobacter echini TaxID=1529066 RepID=A0A4S5E0A1_9MICC|nr:hypothetical protein [Arthrobacter echini]THJ64728.1 hypothetical protein E8P82_14240 [Arthrobacter echini]